MRATLAVILMRAKILAQDDEDIATEDALIQAANEFKEAQEK
jgi:hypothetical protein